MELILLLRCTILESVILIYIIILYNKGTIEFTWITMHSYIYRNKYWVYIFTQLYLKSTQVSQLSKALCQAKQNMYNHPQRSTN